MKSQDDDQNSVSRAIGRRIREVTTELPSAHLGEVCGCSGESARRYRNGATQPGVFLAKLCEGLELDGHWLLTGHRREPHISEILRRASADDLLNELRRRLEASQSAEHNGDLRPPRARALKMTGLDLRVRATSPPATANGNRNGTSH